MKAEVKMFTMVLKQWVQVKHAYSCKARGGGGNINWVTKLASEKKNKENRKVSFFFLFPPAIYFNHLKNYVG